MPPPRPSDAADAPGDETGRLERFRSVVVPALKRFAILLFACGSVTAVCAVLLGLLFGASPLRSISVGFYLVGSFLLLGGFFFGNRGPLRARPEDETEGGSPISFFGRRQIRVATAEERADSINMSVLLIVIGLVLLALGVVADTRYALV